MRISNEQVLLWIAAVVVIVAVAAFLLLRASARERKTLSGPIPAAGPVITLEKQLAELQSLGLKLNDGIAIQDLLNSFPRESYEKRPYDLILFMLGTEVEHEPWGRYLCDRVWNFDTECIAETGDYVSIVERLCRVAGQPGRLKEISDFVDLEGGKAWLKYTVDGVRRNYSVEVNDDWADMTTISKVFRDLERDGMRFYFKDNGQAMVLFCLSGVGLSHTTACG